LTPRRAALGRRVHLVEIEQATGVKAGVAHASRFRVQLLRAPTNIPPSSTDPRLTRSASACYCAGPPDDRPK
jgi:hypothetical protein